jgi:hypothetical protein
MVKRSTSKPAAESSEPDEVFESAAEVFRVMSAPMRLKIISSLCVAEKNVSELLSQIPTTQPNMSQHLNTLYRAGVLGNDVMACKFTTASLTSAWPSFAALSACRSPARLTSQPVPAGPAPKKVVIFT